MTNVIRSICLALALCLALPACAAVPTPTPACPVAPVAVAPAPAVRDGSMDELAAAAARELCWELHAMNPSLQGDCPQ